MGYVPHQAARRLARARSDSRATSFDQIGLIYLTETDIYLDAACLPMMQGIEHELSKLNASLVFVRVTKPEDWKKVERLTQAGGVDGWLLHGAVNDEVVNRLKSAPLNELPYVILADHSCTQPACVADPRSAEGFPTTPKRFVATASGEARATSAWRRPVYSVNVDNAAVGRLAAQHLASLGHRRIGFIGGSMRFAYQQRTLEGFRAALKELGLEDDERLITNHSSWYRPGEELVIESSRELFIEWLRDIGPTALFVPEFDSAAKWCRVLIQSKVEVPKEISLLACEPVSLAAKSQNFTRIELSMDEIGRQGAALLHRIVSKLSVESSEIKISPALIEGWSTGQCKM